MVLVGVGGGCLWCGGGFGVKGSDCGGCGPEGFS